MCVCVCVCVCVWVGWPPNTDTHMLRARIHACCHACAHTAGTAQLLLCHIIIHTMSHHHTPQVLRNYYHPHSSQYDKRCDLYSFGVLLWEIGIHSQKCFKCLYIVAATVLAR